MELEKILESIEPSLLSIKGVSGIGIVDYAGDGNKKIEIAIQTEEARDQVLAACNENKIDPNVLSIINPGKTKVF